MELDLDKQVEVLEAFRDGKQVQKRSFIFGEETGWENVHYSDFNFTAYEYRIKPCKAFCDENLSRIHDGVQSYQGRSLDVSEVDKLTKAQIMKIAELIKQDSDVNR